jgi:uncharacterized protein
VVSGTGGEATPGEGPGEPFDPPQVEWTRVSPRLASARRVVTCGPLLLVAAGLAVLGAVLDENWLGLPAIIPLALGGWAWVIIGRQVRAWGYAERADDLLVRRGVSWRTVVVVPYGRMQYVDVHAGPLEQLFRIASVHLHTASPGTSARIPGLPAIEAARLRDRLTSLGEAQAAGL